MNLPYAGISHLARFMSRIICSTRAGREYTDVKNVSMNSLTKGPSVFPGDEVAPRIESWQVIHLATRERCKRHYRAECRKGCDVIVVRDWVQKFAFTDELHPFHRWWVNERSEHSTHLRHTGMITLCAFKFRKNARRDSCENVRSPTTDGKDAVHR